MNSTRRDFLKTVGAIGLASLSDLTTCRASIPPAKRPNILLILADDMGYSDAECYGGEIRTPTLSALARGGLRFTQHYSTGRCWPSRACILTGYYAQQIRRDTLPGFKLGDRPAWAPLLPAILKGRDYRTYHSGKWHIDGSPADGGFDRSWGAERSGCDWNRYFKSGRWQEDELRAPVQPGAPYYSTTAIADHAITCLQLHQKNDRDKPFFSYVAFYSPHFPLHALPEDIDAYRQAYIEGWDVIRQRRWERMTRMGLIHCALSGRQEDVVPSWNLKPDQLQQRIGPGEAAYAVAWDSLTEGQKTFQAAKMAIHAAMITRMDHAIGRIVRQLKDMGAYENTLILFASDNGASAEQIIRGDGHDPAASMGSAGSFLCLGPGFSTAANTPFKLHKHWNHEGGISSPLIVHWPAGISARNELRHDPSHFIDIVPTLLEVAGADAPATANAPDAPPRPGLSLVKSFARDGSLEHEVLWWCHAGNRAIRMGDWKLSAKDGKQGTWELYDLKVDRCEMNDLATRYPERVQSMAQRWEAMAASFAKNLTAQTNEG
ncbi:MAG: arylsulfatase [Sedimentisphaerales bacterium]|nr:arylsulfatase [Sedimentisphaerales bacterium]